MERAKRTLAIVALAFSVGCTRQLMPATPAPTESVVLHIQSTNDSQQLLELLMLNYQDTFPEQRFESESGNYGTVFQNLLNGETEYFISQHLPTDRETIFWAAPLAQDALAMIVHPSNPINSLSLEEVRSIYQGYIRNWGDVGGVDISITLYSRENASASRLEFERLVMGQYRSSPNAQILPSTTAMIKQVAADPSAIGYIPLSKTSKTIQILPINDIAASIDSVADNSYPLRYTLFIVGLEEPKAQYRDFIAWAQSQEAQAALQEYFAPLPP